MTSNDDLFWVLNDGKTSGPFSYNHLAQAFENEEISDGSLICSVGQDEWEPIQNLFDLEKENEIQSDIGNKRVVMAKNKSAFPNILLTGIAFFLILVCVGLFIYLKSEKAKNLFGKNESPVSESQNNNFEVIASDAIDFALITMVNGYAQTEEGTNFSGWAKSYYQNVDSLSLLIYFNEGLINEAHSWNPDGEKSPETSLQNGTGVISEKNNQGVTFRYTEYKAGQKSGKSAEWHSNGQKSIQESFLSGELHGQKIIWDPNGQKIEEAFYTNGVANGPYSKWASNGQKIEQGIYKDGNLDGRRILWTSDGEVREDQFYENGKMLEPVAKKNEIMDDVLKVENEDPILAKYLENIGEDGNGLEVARGLAAFVKNLQGKYQENEMISGEIFVELGLGLLDQSISNEISSSLLLDSLEMVENRLSVKIKKSANGFILCEIPDRVTFAGLTWDQSEFENLSINLINAESRFSVIEDLKKLFSISDIFLGSDTTFMTTLVKRKMWDSLSVVADEFEKANFKVKQGVLTYETAVNKTIKKINPQGKSEFSTVSEDVIFTFDKRIENKPVGKIFDALNGVRAQYEEIKNGTLTIRKYSNLVIFSDEKSVDGNQFLYPSVTLQIAGVTPFKDSSLIRAIKLDLGEKVEEPIDNENP